MPEPMTISIDDETPTDLHERLGRTRWPDEVAGAGWEYGTNLDYLRELVEYWGDEFDWRKQQERLNRFDHFRSEIDSFGIHFVHERGEGENPTPLLALHGWPSTFVQMLDIVPMLTTPSEFGGDPDESFDVVVASLPGYGFSDRPTEPGMSVPRIADLLHALMTDELGYDRYGGRGSDIGAGVLLQLGLSIQNRLSAYTSAEPTRASKRR